MSIYLNNIMRNILIVQHVLITWSGTLCIYSVIHFWDKLTLPARGVLTSTAFGVLGLWTAILTIAAHTYKLSEKVEDE